MTKWIPGLALVLSPVVLLGCREESRGAPQPSGPAAASGAASAVTKPAASVAPSVASSVAPAASAPASAAAEAPPRAQLLFDYSVDRPKPPVPAAKKAEWLGIFTNGMTLPAACDAKRLDIEGSFEGAFTRKDAKEVAFVVGRCGESPVDQVSYLAVVSEAGRLVAHFKVTGSSLDAVMDVNQDGKSELLLSGASTHQGETVTSAQLVGIQDKKLVTVKSFSEVANDGCGREEKALQQMKAQIVYLTQGATPAFPTVWRKRPCPG